MDYYYSSSPGMSSRGRFSSRGSSSYRGRGGDSSFRGSRGFSSSRGYSSSRGRGSYYPKYDNSMSKFSSDTSRFSTRLEDCSPYRKPDSSPYSRDHRSDDLGRKRLRSESYSQSQGGSGTRRSHELEDYRGGGSRFSNSNSYTDSRGYSDFKKPRISDYKAKEEYRGRREISRSSLASKLRSFRGRSIRGRVLSRGGESFLSRKRAAFSGSRSASEMIALRRTKLLRLRRYEYNKTRTRVYKKAMQRATKVDKDRGEMKKVQMNRLRDRARLRMAEEKAVVEDKEKEDAEKAAAEEKAGDEIKNEEGDKEGDEKTDEEQQKEKKEDGEICEGDTEKKKSDDKPDYLKKTFMKLQCPQCSTKCITFKEYITHLYQPTHIKAMRDKSEQLKKTLAKMRIAQRNNQKKVDEEDVSNMNARTIFCPICKLNYSQEKSKHQASDAHKKLKNFLQPYCRICRIYFKSPMIYERHISSLDHIRKKNALDERLGKTKSLEYLDNFMVVDSVGSGDEVEENKEDKKLEDDTREKVEDKPREEPKNLGVEFIRRVEAFYCEVCRSYLPRHPDHERVLKVHCRTKYHLRCYLRFGSDDLLKQIQGEAKENGEGEKGEGNENHAEGEGGIDEKLWADVSDLLSQVEPNAKSDDEEEEGGRFDKFKSNEKKENGEVAPEEDQGEVKEKCGGVAEGGKLPVKDEA